MGMKKVKTIFTAVSCVSLFLIAMAAGTGKDVFGVVRSVAFIAGIGFWIIFGRCPHCGRFVGKAPGEYCTHCGKKFEE
jgi:hypothetical protein